MYNLSKKENIWKGYHAEKILIYSIQHKEKELGPVDKRQTRQSLVQQKI